MMYIAFLIFLLISTVYLITAVATYFAYEMHEEIFFEHVPDKVKKSFLWFLEP